MTLAAKFEIEYLQYLGPDGKPVGELPEAFRDPKQLVPLFKQMLFVRTFDSKSIKLQRTGKLGTYAASLGHEAAHVGIGASILFGGLYILHLFIHTGKDMAIKELYKMLPYLVTIVVLVLSSLRNKRENQPPESLGLPYFREER